jgi:DNA-directed DNA polymerase III PolC
MYLNCHTFYSLKYGTISIDEWIHLAKTHGLQRICITDINNSTAILELLKLAQPINLDIIAGIEFRDEHDQLLYIGIAKNNEGFFELNEFLTSHHILNRSLPKLAPQFNHVYIIYPFEKREQVILRENEYIGIRQRQISKIIFDKKISREKLVLLQTVSFLNQEQYDLHVRLRAVEYNCLLSQLGVQQIGNSDAIFSSPEQIRKSLEDQNWLLQQTEKLLDECSFDFDFTTIKNKKTFGPTLYDDTLLLEKLTFDGMKYRYGAKNKEAINRIRKELEVINDLGFCSYFLIAHDIIRHTMSKGFYHVGRGSGANSIVAYCLRITDVCPIELDLYFERFLNHKRKSPPDLDIDFSWKDRDEVYDYIFARYGERRTALLGTITTFRSRSILREFGKIYGLPKSEIEALVENTRNDKRPVHIDAITKEILSFESKVRDFPHQRGIHAGGILISEEPLTRYCSLDLPPKGYPTIQFDMYTAEEAGFEKLDILSQRGIGHIGETVDIVTANRGIKVDVHQIAKFKKDKKIAQQLKCADTIGAFYIESPAMRGLLTKLRCDNYITLVAASSIIRPGVAKSGMMKSYIERFHDPSQVDYLHPIMQEQLAETYGVMVYQEDVIKIGHHFGGLDLTESDVLRRLMSGKNRGKQHLPEIEAKFFANCNAKGYDAELTHEVWRQICSFAGYSFSKAHSASFAVESYQSLYLKTYFPLEFYTAVINNFGGFYSTWVYVNAAKKHGATIHLPCVNTSHYYTSIKGKIIYMGFIHIENLEQQYAKQIAIEREKNGSYTDLENFINRLHISLEQVIILIRLEAFAFTTKTKKQLLWEAHAILGLVKVSHADESLLFYEPQEEYTLPELANSNLENIYDEIELMGFPITQTRFDLLKTNFRGEMMAKDLINYVGKQVRMVGELVATKPVRTVNHKLMYFGTWLDANGDFFDTTHFPNTLFSYSFKGMGVYLILGKIVEEFGFASIEVEKMAKLELKADPRGSH